MKKLKRPALNTADLKLPPFFSDLYWDLRDRRLLPLVALVVVAIVAVPFLLGGDGEELRPEAAAVDSLAVGGGSDSTDSASLAVVQAKPGLRDYRKRLRRRTPRNPFKQKYTAPVLEGAKLNPQTTTTSSTTSTTSKTTIGSSGEGSPAPPPPTSTPGKAPTGDGEPGKPHLTFFAYAINVRIVKKGGDGSGGRKEKDADPIVKHEVLPQTPLPGEKAPVVTYMGPARKGDKANGKVLLLVSTDVQSIFGESRCVSGGEVCQLIEVEPGFPVTFVYGANEVRYTINVLKLGLVVTGHS